MKQVKMWVLVMLLVLSSCVGGCVVVSKNERKNQKSHSTNVSNSPAMSEEEKNEFAEMIAKKVVELQQGRSEAKDRQCDK